MKHKLNLIIALSLLLIALLGCKETAKTPEWSKAKIFLDKLDHPSALVTDDKNLYFVTGGTIASLNEGTSGVWKVSLNGGQPVQLFKGYQKDEKTVYIPSTYIIATDEKYVYFSTGTIFRVPKDGGNAEEITAGNPTEMALDDENIYWHDYVGEGMKDVPIFSVSKKGGERKTLTDAANISDIAVDKDFLYWSQADGIYKVSKKGGEKIRVYAVANGKRINAMTADANSLYVIENDTLLQIPKDENSNKIIAEKVNYTNKFYADEANIYFVKNEGSFGTSLNKVSKNGGEVTKIDDGYLASFTVSKDKIFVSDVAKIYEIGK